LVIREFADRCSELFGGATLPVAVAGPDFSVVWLNDEAKRAFPSLTFAGGLRDYMSVCDMDDVVKVLSSGAPYTVPEGVIPFDSLRLTLVPVPGSGFAGCLAIFSPAAPGASSPDAQQSILSAFQNSYKLPLTIIFSTLSLMSRAMPEGDNVMRTYLKLVSQNCYRLLRMSNNLTDSARFASGAATLNMRRGDLAAFLRGLCGAAGVMTAAMGIPLTADVPGGCVMALFDPPRLSTAVLNLISNSCRFTRSGNEIAVKLAVTGGSAVVTVTDKGAGIKSELIGRVFESNFSFDPAGLPYGGNGQGLAIMRNIIAMHGGTVALASREGEGTRVAFTLPLGGDDRAPDYTAETAADYLSDRFSCVYVELSDVCGAPSP
jgi:hypothetical protein